jgi:hypothetical protein
MAAEIDPASNARVRSFFGCDPVEFVDDVICAMASYVTAGIESLSSLITATGLSENHKAKFCHDLSAQMQKSINENSDIFELYVVRNICHVPIDVDLAAELSDIHQVQSPNIEASPVRVDDSGALDDELMDLRERIRVEQGRRRHFVEELRRTQAQISVFETLDRRLAKIRELKQLVDSLPSRELEGRIEELKDLLRGARKVSEQARNDTVDSAMRSLAFHQAGFVFD